MIEFVWPQTTGEWLAWVSALYMLIFGFVLLLAPGRWLATFQDWLGLGDGASRQNPSAPASLMRAMGGGNFGLALAVLALHPQPLLYLALAATFAFRVVGRLLANLIDKGRIFYLWPSHWIMLVVEAILGYFALAYAFGLIR